MTRIVLYSDQPILAQGLRSVLSGANGFEIHSICTSMTALMEAITAPPRRRLRTVLSVIALLGTAGVGAMIGASRAGAAEERACTSAAVVTGSHGSADLSSGGVDGP